MDLSQGTFLSDRSGVLRGLEGLGGPWTGNALATSAQKVARTGKADRLVPMVYGTRDFTMVAMGEQENFVVGHTDLKIVRRPFQMCPKTVR